MLGFPIHVSDGDIPWSKVTVFAYQSSLSNERCESCCDVLPVLECGMSRGDRTCYHLCNETSASQASILV